MARRSSRRQVSPREFHGVLGGFISVVGTLLLHLHYEIDLAVSWLIAINAVTFINFVIDKSNALIGRRRIPEDVLLVGVLLGGGGGGLIGMLLCRHKIKKASFMSRFWAIIVLQAVSVCIWYFALR